jgi:hypothetical protein
VPDGKSPDGLLKELAKKWNLLYDSQQRKNLIEDMNTLVRDFIRPLKRSFLLKPPDSKRIHNLAEQLYASKNLTKITRRDALIRYLKLYVIRRLDMVM